MTIHYAIVLECCKVNLNAICCRENATSSFSGGSERKKGIYAGHDPVLRVFSGKTCVCLPESHLQQCDSFFTIINVTYVINAL